jgi:hypothetical protein
MKSERGSRHLIFKACTAVGFLLGIVLLWQTISTYTYVSGNMMTQAAQRDADQKRAILQRAIRPGISGSHESPNLDFVLTDSIEEWKDQVAWIESECGRPGRRWRRQAPESAGITLLRREPEFKRRLWAMRSSPHIPTTSDARGMRLEVAIYLNSVSASFASCQNLILGSLPLALMGL